MDSSKPTKSKCALLDMLPKPKNSVISKSKTSLIPSALMTKRSVEPMPIRKRKLSGSDEPSESIKEKESKPQLASSIKSLVTYGDSSDSEDDEEQAQSSSTSDPKSPEDSKIDFFGINSKALDIEPIAVPSSTGSLTSDAIVGPEKPQSMAFSYPVVEPELDAKPSTSQFISHQVASKMIYEKELAPYGGSTIVAAEAANNLIDVSVDRALGPHVRENLLKNLNNKALAQVAVGPLPKVKKDPKDRLSKQKHQITHLAGLAVAREEMLQEQWAENKQKKRASARRYGF